MPTPSPRAPVRKSRGTVRSGDPMDPVLRTGRRRRERFAVAQDMERHVAAGIVLTHAIVWRRVPFMKKLLIIATIGLGLAACQADSQRDRALVGTGLGAATGAAVGGAVGDTEGAVVGGVVGGAAGAIAGAATTPSNCVDQFGNPVPCP